MARRPRSERISLSQTVSTSRPRPTPVARPTRFFFASVPMTRQLPKLGSADPFLRSPDRFHCSGEPFLGSRQLVHGSADPFLRSRPLVLGSGERFRGSPKVVPTLPRAIPRLRRLIPRSDSLPGPAETLLAPQDATRRPTASLPRPTERAPRVPGPRAAPPERLARATDNAPGARARLRLARSELRPRTSRETRARPRPIGAP